MPASQRKAPLQPEQREKYTGQQWSANRIDQRNSLHRLELMQPAVTLSSADRWRQRAADEANESFLSADAPEHEGGLGLYHLAVYLDQGVGEKIDRAARRLGIDHQIAAFGQLETICWIMTEIVIRQLWIFPRFTDIHRHPASICVKFRPAMVAFDRALILVGWNRRANGKTRVYSDAARQSDEISVKIAAVTGSGVACVHGIAAAPAGSGFVVTHSAHYMIIKRFRPFEIVVFPCSRFLSERPEGFINRHQFFRGQVTRSFRTACRVGGLLLTNHTISHLHGFTAVRRLRIEHANIIAVIAVVHFFPFHRDVQLVLGHGLKSVGRIKSRMGSWKAIRKISLRTLCATCRYLLSNRKAAFRRSCEPTYL